MKIITFAILFSVLMVVPSYALTGNELLKLCRDKGQYIDPYGIGRCDGLLQGIRNMNDLTNAMIEFHSKNKIPMRKTCLPKEVTLGQLNKIVKKWFNEHPENLHKDFALQYLTIIRETFPCENQ
jgi:hypothetical protein